MVAAFIVVACAATIWATGQGAHVDPSTFTAADAARALAPVAGPAAEVLFAVGLLAASLLGLGVVPLSSAYTACEAFGWETGVDWRWREAPAFYSFLALFVAFPAAFVLLLSPGQLVPVMFLSQVLNGLLLPFILVFVMLLADDKRVMGSLRSGRFLLWVGWLSTIVLAAMSILLVVLVLRAAGLTAASARGGRARSRPGPTAGPAPACPRRPVTWPDSREASRMPSIALDAALLSRRRARQEPPEPAPHARKPPMVGCKGRAAAPWAAPRLADESLRPSAV